MDEQLLAFLNGNANAVQTDVFISRDILPSGLQHVYISVKGKDLYDFWYKPDHIAKSKNPKHTGGRKPYIMLMVNEVEKLRADGVKNIEELIGFLVCLGKNIEWGTCKLVHKRSKKPLKYTDLQKLFTGGKRKLDRVLSDLKANGLLTNTSEGYFIAQKLIKKGAARNGR